MVGSLTCMYDSVSFKQFSCDSVCFKQFSCNQHDYLSSISLFLNNPYVMNNPLFFYYSIMNNPYKMVTYIFYVILTDYLLSYW